MRARNRTEGENDCERSAGRDRMCKERDRDVSTRTVAYARRANRDLAKIPASDAAALRADLRTQRETLELFGAGLSSTPYAATVAGRL